MNITTLIELAGHHAYNAVAESVYLTTGLDTTKPVTFFGIVNEVCNVKCRYCDYWRMKDRKTEMTIEEWKSALLSIKEFVGKFSISFKRGRAFPEARLY